MKVPCCSVCQTKYNEKERVPLLLQCGHGFCKECLSRMFSASSDTTLSCPRCRHVSVVGNSVTALRKNYAVLAVILSAAAAKSANKNGNGNDRNNYTSFDSDVTDEEEEEEEQHGDRSYENGDVADGRCGRGSHTSSSGAIEVGVHSEVKWVKKIGEGRRAGVEVWAAEIRGRGAIGRTNSHKVAVKRIPIAEGMDVDWVMGQLDTLKRTSMWCRNVCTFHGVSRMDGFLGLVMDKCSGSVQSAMHKNEGRLTLEQILRFCSILISYFFLL